MYKPNCHTYIYSVCTWPQTSFSNDGLIHMCAEPAILRYHCPLIIAECISTRLWMTDLFSHCMYMLSCLEMSTLEIGGANMQGLQGFQSLSSFTWCWEVSVVTSELHVLQMIKLGRAWEKENGATCRYEPAGPSGLAELEQVQVELNSECSRHLHISVPHLNSYYTFKQMVNRHVVRSVI